jgi:type II secretion system protein D
MASTGRASLSSSRSRVPARVLALAAGWCVATTAPLLAQSTAPEKTPLEETAKQSQQPTTSPGTTTTTGGPPGAAPVTAAGGVVAPPGATPSSTPTVVAPPRPIGENPRLRNRPAAQRPGQPNGQPQNGQPQNGQPQNGQPAGQPGNRPAGQPGLPGDGGQPGAAQPASHIPEPPADGPVRFDAFSEPVELSTLVDYIARSLGINITVKGTLSGQVVFNAPVEVERSRLRGLLAALLEQHNFALVYDEESTFYSIVPANETGMRLGDTLGSTRVFATPNVRASTVKQVIDAQLMGGGAIGGGGAPTMNKVSAVDELGVLVVTETPRKLDQIGNLVDAILAEYAKNEFIRLDLKYVAAPIARERALQLVGQSSGRTNQLGIDQNQGIPQQIPGLGGSTGRLDNLGDRLTVDAQSNALVFRGLPEEVAQVERIIEVIDVPNNLIANTYFVGSAAKQIADVARGRGLGEVTQISTRQSNQNQYNAFYTGFDPNQFQNQQRQGSNVGNGGPVMVVDESTGRIFYYGTEQQQKELSTLIDQLDIESEQVVIRGYKLKNGDAEQMTELILGILQNRTPEGEGSSLLPGGNSVQQPPSVFFPQPMGNEELSISSDNVFVVADKANNQIMVKAPQKQQKEFQKLIDTLDLRRPQVYIEAKIVAVTTDDRLRLAFETQLINANGTGGVLNTNFGLGSFATGADFTDRKSVATGLTGLTAAVIKSDQVPIIINALKRETDSRIISCPQLLANDNEEAEVASVDTTPIPSISRGTGGSGDIVTSSGDAEAGTKLKVTPHISEAGYLRLEYDIELSSFTGEAQDNLPPPKQVNNIKSIVTLPSDATIVVGGLVLDSNTKTIVKVPLLGDIPIIGELFKDRNQGDRKTTLYIFLKPRIYSDPYFADAKLGTKGPSDASELPDALPPLKASTIEIVETDRNKRSQ